MKFLYFIEKRPRLGYVERTEITRVEALTLADRNGGDLAALEKKVEKHGGTWGFGQFWSPGGELLVKLCSRSVVVVRRGD